MRRSVAELRRFVLCSSYLYSVMIESSTWPMTFELCSWCSLNFRSFSFLAFLWALDRYFCGSFSSPSSPSPGALERLTVPDRPRRPSIVLWRRAPGPPLLSVSDFFGEGATDCFLDGGTLLLFFSRKGASSEPLAGELRSPSSLLPLTAVRVLASPFSYIFLDEIIVYRF